MKIEDFKKEFFKNFNKIDPKEFVEKYKKLGYKFKKIKKGAKKTKR